METQKTILPLQIPVPFRDIPTSKQGDGPTSNIIPLVPVKTAEVEFRLVDAPDLILAAQQRLAMRLNRSSLCQLRAAGMPFVRFSTRRIRYDLAACLEWLILRSFREGRNAHVDPIQLLSHFGLCPNPNGAA